MNSEKKISCIVPAFNEAGRISAVLKLLIDYRKFDEIIVVDDGSSDATVEEASKFEDVKVIQHTENKGKADALVTGVEAATSEIVFFCDADLRNFTHAHLDELTEAILSGENRMVCGAQEYMHTGREGTGYDKEMPEHIKFIGGEKLLYKADFLKMGDLRGIGFKVENRIMDYYINNNLPYKLIVLKGVGHVHKSEKWGFWYGYWRDLLAMGEMGVQMVMRWLGLRKGPSK